MKLNLVASRICSLALLLAGFLTGIVALAGTAPASPPALLSIQVTPANSTMPVTLTRQFTAIGTFSDGSSQDLTASVAWSSSNHTVANISNAAGSNGLATGLTPGMTQINAQLGGVLGSTTLTVTGATLVAINVTPVNPTVAAGAARQFTATGTFSDGSSQDLTTSVTWSSNQASIATISNAAGSRGVATGISPGTTNISAQSDSVVGFTTLTVTPVPGCQQTTSIAANFNATAISRNSFIWFSGVLKPKGLGSSPATFRFVQQQITSASFTLSVPDAMVTFDPAATTATTTFTGGVWVTRVPSSGLPGNTFLSGLGYMLPANLAGGLKNVTWSGTVIPDTPGTSLQWQWAAAVYPSFSNDYNAIGIKPVDDSNASQFKNSDHAGTPENFKTGVIGGATGGGANNYTGSLSSAKGTTSCADTPPLVVTKSAPASTNRTQIPYTITYTNPSSRTVSNIQLSDTLPAGTTYIVGSGVPAPTSISGNTLTWNLPPEAAHATASVSFRVSVNSDGTYANTAVVRFSDAVGAISSNTVTTVRDSVPPAVTVIAGPSGVTNTAAPSFRFTTDSSAVTKLCAIDNTNFTPCSPDPAQYTSAPLAEGPHTFTVRVSDATGNTAAASRTFTVDLTPPVVTFADPPVNPPVTNNSTPRFYFTVNDTGATTFCSVAGDPFAPCVSPFTTRTLSDGAYTVSAYARDAAGNTGPIATFSFVIDAHPPIISIPIPPNVTTTSDNTPTFTFADVGPAGTAVTFQCRTDAGPNAPCASPFTAATSLSDGAHTFTVTGTDAAGNVGQSSLSFVVDTVPPIISIPVPPNVTTTDDNTPTFTFADVGPAGTAVAFQCRTDGGPNAPCASPFTAPTSLSDGAHTFTVTGTDAAGNVGQASLAFVVDTVPPIISIPVPPNVTTTDDNTPTFTFADVGPAGTAVAFQCRTDGGPNAPCASPFTAPTSLSDGAHTFTVTGTDAAGNTGQASLAFVVDTVPPMITIPGAPTNPPDVSTSTPTLFFQVANSPPITPVVFSQCTVRDASPPNAVRAQSPPNVFCDSAFSVLPANALTDGSYIFQVAATDAAGNAGTSNYTFTVTTAP